MIGERLYRARKATDLSMQALGERCGVSANMIKKYEHNQSMPRSPVLLKLAKALGVRTEYFFRPVTVELSGIEYRKRSSTGTKVLRRIEADVLDQAERWQALANLWPNFPVPNFQNPVMLDQPVDSLEAVDAIAEQVRMAWSLGLNPIHDLIDTLESRGILVIITDVDNDSVFDGLQARVAGKPFVVVSSHASGDRQRFTLAHELGHLILHNQLADGLDEEKACNRFAGAFLLPAGSLREQLGDHRHTLEPRELYLLKHEYGISMGAIAYRAGDLGIISASTLRKLFVLFSRNRWKKQEPGKPYPQEETVLYQQLVYRALGEGLLGEGKAAELLGMPLMTFHQERKLEQQNAAAYQ